MSSKELQDIPIKSIHPSALLLRPLNPATVSELADSIKAQGLLQHPMVRRDGDIFRIVFGYHRVEACKSLGWQKIPCYVCEMDDAKAFLTSEVENVQKNVFINPVAEAKGFEMLKQQGMAETQIAKEIGKTQQYVSSRLNLLRLDPYILEFIAADVLPVEHGYELSKIEDEKKRNILAELCMKNKENHLTLMEVRAMAKQPLDELRKDPRVEEILLRDPMERIKRIEAGLADLKKEAKPIGGWMLNTKSELISLNSKMNILTANGLWKRDNCIFYNGDICQNWGWNENPGWSMRKEGDKWVLCVSQYPEYCATCSAFNSKASSKSWSTQLPRKPFNA